MTLQTKILQNYQHTKEKWMTRDYLFLAGAAAVMFYIAFFN